LQPLLILGTMDSKLDSDVVVVGGVAAGPKTAAALARRCPEKSITLFERGDTISYGTCGMPYFASGDISSFDELTKTSWGTERSPEFFRCSKGFTVVTDAEVIKIDRESKTVTVRRATGETFEHGYGSLVLATGSRPKDPPFEVAESKIVRHFTRPEDALGFRQLAERGKIGEAVIIGGGFIGVELAEAAGGLWGIQTSLIECERQILPYVLDPEMAALAEAELTRQDVNVITGARVSRVSVENDRATITYRRDGSEAQVEADYVSLCLGVEPVVTLASDCGLEIGATGGIRVNEKMQTSDPHIFAGGDCTESHNLISEQAMYLPMGSLANRHGRVIAETIAGNEASFPGVVGAFLVKVYDTNAGAVGLSEQAANAAGLKARAVWGAFSDRPDYYPEHATIVVKLVYEADTMRLLGLQAIGAGDICRRIDVLSTYLQRCATVTDLLDFEHGYAPPYSEALDPLHHLAAMAQAQEQGRVTFTHPAQARAATGDNILWLDVRELDEIDSAPLIADGSGPAVVQIRLNDLVEHLDQLDRSKRIFVICRRGPRAFQAAHILRANGFDDVTIIGGGTNALTQ